MKREGNEGLAKFRQEAKRLVESHGVDYKVAMRALGLARKRSLPVDEALLREAKEMVIAKRTEKINHREKELKVGKIQRLYIEHLLETIVEQNRQLIDLLSSRK